MGGRLLKKMQGKTKRHHRCLSDDDLGSCLAGRYSRRIEKHLNGCSYCRQRLQCREKCAADSRQGWRFFSGLEWEYLRQMTVVPAVCALLLAATVFATTRPAPEDKVFFISLLLLACGFIGLLALCKIIDDSDDVYD